MRNFTRVSYSITDLILLPGPHSYPSAEAPPPCMNYMESAPYAAYTRAAQAAAAAAAASEFSFKLLSNSRKSTTIVEISQYAPAFVRTEQAVVHIYP